MTTREQGEALAAELEQAATHLPSADVARMSTELLLELTALHPRACGCRYHVELRTRAVNVSPGLAR